MSRHHNRNARLSLESLEGRLCLSAADLLPAVPVEPATIAEVYYERMNYQILSESHAAPQGSGGKVQMQDFHSVARSSATDLDLAADDGSTEDGIVIPSGKSVRFRPGKS